MKFKIIKNIQIGNRTVPTTIFIIVLVKCSILILRIRIQTCWKCWIRIRVKVMRRFETLADGLKNYLVPHLVPLTLLCVRSRFSNLKNQHAKEMRSARRRFSPHLYTTKKRNMAQNFFKNRGDNNKESPSFLLLGFY
jgi:hypothetical protein